MMQMDNFKLNTIDEALDDFRNGKFVIVVDDEDRENEGDFIIAAEKITPEAVNFMLKNGRGVLCRIRNKLFLGHSVEFCEMEMINTYFKRTHGFEHTLRKICAYTHYLARCLHLRA